MSSKAFQSVLAGMKASKNIDKILVGDASQHLNDTFEGEVTITAVGPTTDKAGNEIDGKMSVTYTAEDGKAFTDHMFLSSQDGTELSYGVRALLSALIPDTSFFEEWVDIAINDEHAMQMFVGMKLGLKLKTGNGFKVHAEGTGGFAAYDYENGKQGEKVTDTFPTVQEARDAARGKGLYGSWPKIAKQYATHVEANKAAWETAKVERTKAKPAVKVGKVV